MKKKKGSTAISVAILTVVGIMLVCVLIAYIINLITPLILQQKLQAIANKYMYVVEKYGYLTETEKDELLEELESESFDISRITLNYPSVKRAYGEILELSITYKYNSIPVFGMEERNITVKKNSYSKV